MYVMMVIMPLIFITFFLAVPVKIDILLCIV